jgi:Arc/MetJ-type ribon-helix-helix transcriptional regulator
MARIDAKLPTGLAALLEASGESGLFRGKSDAARTAVRAYLEANPDVAVDAVRALATDEETEHQLTLGDAVRLTGRPPSEFSEELQAVLRANEVGHPGGDADGA